MEARSNKWMLMRKRFLRNAMEMVLRRQTVTSRENATFDRAPHENHEPTPIDDAVVMPVEIKGERTKNQKKPCDLWAASMQQTISI